MQILNQFLYNQYFKQVIYHVLDKNMEKARPFHVGTPPHMVKYFLYEFI